MKKFKLTKSNIIALALVVCAITITMAGGTVAYFTDNREMVNVFTAGHVYRSLTEAQVKDDGMGNLIEDTSLPRIQGVAVDSANPVTQNYGMLYPGRVMHKDPTITNTGDDPAYIAAKIIIKDGAGDITKLYGYENEEDIDIRMMLSGGLLGEANHVGNWNGFEYVSYNDNFAMIQMADAANGTYEFYIFINNELQKGEQIELFDTMEISPDFSGAQMQEFAQLEITVQAFAVQTFGFADSYTAMTRAFGDHFAKVAPTTAP